MRRLLASSACVLSIGVLTPSVASAQSLVNIYVGGFLPRGDQLTSGSISGRSSDDVLSGNSDFLDFSLHDFHGATVGGEWLFGLGENIEGGLGVGFYSKTVPAIYDCCVNQDTGADFGPDLNLRIVPFTATVRFLPLGRRDAFTPYIGAGVGVFTWHYSESGQFLGNDGSIFRGTFTGTGSAAGPVILGGVRVPIGNAGIGGEIRWQSASGSLPADQGFTGSKIDLGGVNYLFTVYFKF
jgi:hypothetical protein